MAELKYEPVSQDHKAFLKNAQKRKGFIKVIWSSKNGHLVKLL